MQNIHTREVTINVTQTCIDEGVRQDPYACPIAQALTLQGKYDVEVTQSVISFRDYEDEDIYNDELNPLWKTHVYSRIANFMTAFDLNGPEAVTPFEFTLEFYYQEGTSLRK
jgi:hypothetical protein